MRVCIFTWHLLAQAVTPLPPFSTIYQLFLHATWSRVHPFSTANLVACPAPYSWLFFPFPPMVSMRSILCVTKRDCYFIIKSFFDCSLHHPHPTSPSPPPSLPHLPLPHPNGFHMKPLCAIWLFVNPHGYLSTHKVSRRRLFWMLF